MTFQEKIAAVANAIGDYLSGAPADSLARLYDILTAPAALASKEA